MRRAWLNGKRSTLVFGLVLTAGLFGTVPVLADDWPQWFGPQRDGVWREKDILEKFPAGGPRELWRTPIGGGYAGPAVADGKVYVTDRFPSAVVAGFQTAVKERVLCLDEKTGKVLWKHEYPCSYKGLQYPAGPRCTPLVADGKVYTLGAVGHLFCLDITNGKVIWSKDFRKDYGAMLQKWGFAGHPLLDGDRLICLVGGPKSTVVAFDKDTGKEIWKTLNVEEAGYAPPMIYEIGGKRQLIVWHPEGIDSLNPENAQVNWNHRYDQPVKVALTIPTPRLVNNKIFVTAFYDGPLMLQLDKSGGNPRVLWQGKSRSEHFDRTDGLHSIMPTPVIKDGYIYGVCSYGELRCLDAETGERLWMTRKATTRDGEPVRWANAFLIPHEDRYFLFNEQGDLIIANLSPKGYEEIDRVNILPPTNTMAGKGRRVLWSHPAFANRNLYARNDAHLVCVSLAKE